MAFQGMNFANIAPQSSSIANLAEELAKGYQAAQLPWQMEQQRRSAKIGDELNTAKTQALNIQNEQAKMFMNALNSGDPLMRQIALHKIGGVPFNAETPEQKTQRAIQEKIAEQKGLDEQKRLEKQRASYPIIKENLAKISQLKNLISKRKNQFGPGLLGYDVFGPSYRARHLKPEEREDYGIITDIIGTMIGQKAGELSTRPLAMALGTAKELKPSYSDYAEVALGKVKNMEDHFIKALQQIDPNIRDEIDKKSQETNNSGNGMYIITPKGKRVWMPTSEALQALKAGGKRG